MDFACIKEGDSVVVVRGNGGIGCRGFSLTPGEAEDETPDEEHDVDGSVGVSGAKKGCDSWPATGPMGTRPKAAQELGMPAKAPAKAHWSFALRSSEEGEERK